MDEEGAPGNFYEELCSYENLASLIATWQYQKLDLKKELHRVLSANLC